MAGINLSGIAHIYKARFAAKAVLAQEVFAILGIAVGVALLFASQITSTSLTHSAFQLDNRLVGGAQLQLEARGPEGFSETLFREVRRLRGVRHAIPVLERQIDVIGPSGERSVDLIGLDPSSLRTSGPVMRRFSAKQLAALQAIALPTPLAREIDAGPLVAVDLRVGAQLVEALVGATLGQGEIGQLIHSPVAMTSLKYAHRLAGTAGLSRLLVRFDPQHRNEVHKELARLASLNNVNLVSSQFDSRLFKTAVTPESESEALFSGISALVGFMFALNAMLLTVPSRRRLIEDLRPHGAALWDMVKILLFDAFVVGISACVLGLGLGDILSIIVFHATPGYLALAFPIANGRELTWQSAVFAGVAGMVAAIVGVLWPLIGTSRHRPRLPRLVDHRRFLGWLKAIVGVICLALTTTALLADTRATLIGNITLLLALVCLLPLIFDGFVSLCGQISAFIDGVASSLTVTVLQTPQTRVRSLAIAATVAIAVFGTVEFQGTQANLRSGLNASTRDLDFSAQIWVTPRGDSSLLATVPFKATNTAGLANLPGVRRLGVYRGSFLNWNTRRLEVRGRPSSTSEPIPSSQFLGHDLSLASQRIREGGWAVLSRTLASEHKLRVGQSFVLPSPRPILLRLAGLTTNLGWPPGAIILGSGDYARAWANEDPSAYEIQLDAGASAAAVRNGVQRALGPKSGLIAETATERAHRHYALVAQGFSRLTQIRQLVLAAAILAVIGAMGAMIWQRRDLIAFIKCHGYGESVLWRWLLCEAALLIGVGGAVGALFGLYAQLLGSHFLASVTGFPTVFELEGLAAISSFVLVSVSTIAVVALPGLIVVRVPPKTNSPAY